MGPASSSDDSKNTHDETESNGIQIPVHNEGDQDISLPSQEAVTSNEPQVFKPTQDNSVDSVASVQPGGDASPKDSVSANTTADDQFSEPSEAFGMPQLSEAEEPITKGPQPVDERSAATSTPPQPVSVLPTDKLFAPDTHPIMAGTQKGSGKKKKAALFVGILAIILLLGGAFAAAYYGVVIPNRPENVLRQAVKNTSQQQYVASTLKVDIAPKGSGEDSNFPAVKIESKGAMDVTTGQSESANKLTISGVDVALDTKYVDKNMYFKVGDLKSVTALAGTYLGGAENTQVKDELDKAAGVLKDQWIEVDSTLLDQAKVSCSLSSDNRLTDKDLQLLEDQFTKHQFISMNSSNKEDLNGKKAIKYELTLDEKKAKEFIDDKKLEALSFVKKLEECYPKDEGSVSPESVKDSVDTIANGNEKYTFNLWVDAKEKVISKVSFATEDQSKKPESVRAAIEATMTYDKVSFTKPENAKPAMQIWGELQQASPNLFGSLGSMFGSGLRDSVESDSNSGVSADGQSGDVIFEGEVQGDL